MFDFLNAEKAVSGQILRCALCDQYIVLQPDADALLRHIESRLAGNHHARLVDLAVCGIVSVQSERVGDTVIVIFTYLAVAGNELGGAPGLALWSMCRRAAMVTSPALRIQSISSEYRGKQ